MLRLEKAARARADGAMAVVVATALERGVAQWVVQWAVLLVLSQ